jgi:hypothetical protein
MGYVLSVTWFLMDVHETPGGWRKLEQTQRTLMTVTQHNSSCELRLAALRAGSGASVMIARSSGKSGVEGQSREHGLVFRSRPVPERV